MKEQSRRQFSLDDGANGENAPHTTSRVSKRELQKGRDQIDALLEECDDRRKDIANREMLTVTCLVKGDLDVRGFVSAIEQQKISEDSLQLRTNACYRSIYLISKLIEEAE
jgi:hypothetical protein